MKLIRNIGAWSAVSLYGVSAAGAGPFDYKLNGADWKNAYPDCGKTNQSPINLSSSDSAPYKKWASSEDKFVKEYNNQYEEVKVLWTGGTTT